MRLRAGQEYEIVIKTNAGTKTMSPYALRAETRKDLRPATRLCQPNRCRWSTAAIRWQDQGPRTGMSAVEERPGITTVLMVAAL